MSDKNRWRDTQKKRYDINKRRKKRAKIKKQSHDASRKVRNYVRAQIKPFYTAFRDIKNKHLLFVMKDSDNMERVLLQKSSLGKGYALLHLPYINEEMINQYMESVSHKQAASFCLSADNNEALKGIIQHYYSVSFDDIKDCPQGHMLVFRDCKPLGIKEDLVPLNVRPYNLNTWYSNFATTLNGYKVYKGNNLKSFFQVSHDLGKTYVFHDTITELLLYKAMMGKISYQDLLSDQLALSRRHFLGSGLYMVLATDDDELYERFKNEKKESEELER